MDKEQQKKLLTEIMEADEKDGLYESTLSIPAEPEPWGVTFTWKDRSAKVKFKNGEDILKLAEVFSQYLIANGIENTLEKQ